MKDKLFKAEKQFYSPSILLDRIWTIDADNRYYRDFSQDDDTDRFVKKNGIRVPHADNVVALRTVGGNGCLEIGGEKLELGEESVVLFRLAQPRKYYTLGSGWHFFWYEFRIDGTPLDLQKVIYKPVTGEEKALTKKCIQYLKNNSRHKYISILFSLLLETWLEDLPGSKDLYKQQIEELVDYLYTDFLNPSLSVKVLAKKCGMSERLFRDQFLKTAGKSPHRFIIDLKIKYAKELLISTDTKIYEIAEKLGYSDQHVFCTRFKNETGLSPRQFREHNGK